MGWIGYCSHFNKVWGWFEHCDNNKKRTMYCFWVMNLKKTIKFREYSRYTGANQLAKIKDKKIKNQYVEISVDDLVAKWPNFFGDLENSFIFEKLREVI